MSSTGVNFTVPPELNDLVELDISPVYSDENSSHAESSSDDLDNRSDLGYSDATSERIDESEEDDSSDEDSVVEDDPENHTVPPRKLGLHDTIKSQPQWRIPVCVSEQVKEKESPSKLKRSLMDFPNEILIIIAEQLVTDTICSLSEPCGLFWHCDRVKRKSHTKPGAAIAVGHIVGLYRYASYIPYIAKCTRSSMVHILITYDHYWKWLWKQLGLAQSNTFFRELTWPLVDKLVPLIDDAYHETLARKHLGLSSLENDHVLHGSLQCARDFLHQAAVVQRTNWMEMTLKLQKSMAARYSFDWCLLRNCIEWRHEEEVLSQ